MGTVSAQIHVKDSSGVLCDVLPMTTISNVSGLQTALDGKVSTVSGKELSTNDYTTTEKNKLAGIADNANNYVHPTSSGNKHIPSGGSSGQFLKWSADGTATWAADNNTWNAMVGATSSANGSVGYVNAVPPKDGYNTKYLRADGSWQVPPNTTYSTASTSANGLMSSTDKSKLDGIANGATANIGTVTDVKVGSTSYSPSSGVVSLPAYPTTLPASDVYSWAKASSKPTYTYSEVGAAASSHTHNYAGSSSAGGVATSAAKLSNTSKIGDKNKPVYFKADGTPAAISYTINKSVPSNAVFTDTTYSAATQSANGLMSSDDKCFIHQLVALFNILSTSVSEPLYSRASYSDVYTIFERTITISKSQFGISNSKTIAAFMIFSEDSRVPAISNLNIDNANNCVSVIITQNISQEALNARITFVIAYN